MALKCCILLSILMTACSSSKGLKNYKDLSTLPHVVIDLRYATDNNFLSENIYGEFNKAYLHPEAYEKFKEAGHKLQELRPGWKFLVFDALRPHAAQEKLFEKVKGTEQEIYVANPKKKSIHSFGMAIDLTLLNVHGLEVDMGTEFDAFIELAQPKHEERFLKEKKLTKTQVDNRKILREVMESAGFIQLPHEWWHFDALDSKTIRTQYVLFE